MNMSNGNDNEDVFVSDENHGMTAYAFAERVKHRIADLGIGNYERPKLEKDHEGVILHLKKGEYFDGRLPTVIRHLSLDQLSSLFALYANWFGYITTQFMIIATERSEAIRQKEFMMNHLKNHYRVPDTEGGKLPETAVTDAAKTDKRFIMVNARYEELNALFNMLEAMREVANQDMKVISREVTIQQEKFQKELLLQGFGNRGREREHAAAIEGESSYGETSDTATEGVTPRPARPGVNRTKVQVPRVQRR
jgi:hypothetical protein